MPHYKPKTTPIVPASSPMRSFDYVVDGCVAPGTVECLPEKSIFGSQGLKKRKKARPSRRILHGFCTRGQKQKNAALLSRTMGGSPIASEQVKAHQKQHEAHLSDSLYDSRCPQGGRWP
jgi:hypothetical protein